MQLSNRPNFLDYSKAIGIYLVLFGHYVYRLNIPFSNNYLWNNEFNVTLFHMPLFFMVSGILFKSEGNLTMFWKKSIRRLLIPYLYISLICLLIGMVLFIVNSDTDNITDLIIKLLKTGVKCLLGIMTGGDFWGYGHNTYASPLWFVISLFWIQLFMQLFITSRKYRYYLLFIASVLFIATLLYGNFLALRICSSVVGLFFFFIGFYYKAYFMKMVHCSKIGLLFLFCVTLSILCLCAYYGFNYNSPQGFFSINSLKFGEYPILFFISGVAGSIMIFSLSQLCVGICKTHTLTISNGTLIVLGFHSIIYIMFQGFIDSQNLLFALFFSFFILILCYGVIILSTKYFPVLLGGRTLHGAS